MASRNDRFIVEENKNFTNPANVSIPGYSDSGIDITKSVNGWAVSWTFVAPVADASKSAEQIKTESDFNAKQAAFDAQNAAGTKIENLDKVQTQSEIDAQRAKKTTNLATSAPQPVAPTTETSQKPVTAQAEKKSFQVAATPQVNYDTATGREQEVIDNLSKFYQQGATDYESLKKMAGYATADQGKKDVIDAFYQSKQPRTEDQFFSVLSSWNRVFNAQSRQTPEYQSASRRVESLNKYRNFSSSQFSSALKSGSLIPGTQAYRDLQNDPNASANLAKAVTLNAINGVGVDENSVKSSVMGEIYSSPFGKAVADGYIDPQEADAMMTTDEIRSKQAQIEPLKNKYDALKASYDAVETEVDNELKWTGATDSYKNALVAARRKDIYKDLQVATDAYNNAVGTLADLKKAQSDVLSMNLGLYKDAQAFAKQKELAQFQSDLAITQKRKEFEQQLAQKAATASDPVLATQDVIDQYRKMGVLAQRSDAEIVQDVKNQVASGKSIGQALTELNKAFQSKSEYKSAVSKQFPSTSDWEIVNIVKDGVTQSMERNKNTGELRQIGSTGWVSASDYGLPAGSFSDLTSTLKRTGTNVGKDTNNPGNIMAENPKQVEYAKSLGAIGSYTSPNGRTYAVFPDMATGKQATMSDIKTKLSGGSSWVTPDTTLGQFATGWTVWPNAKYNSNAASAYSKFTWYSPDTRIKDIPIEKLADAVIRNEGVDPNVSADVGSAIKATVPQFAQNFLGALQRGEFTTSGGQSGARQYTATEQSLLAKYLKDPSDKDVKKEMSAQGLTKEDANAFSSNKPKTTELTDDQRTLFNSQLSAFRGNQVVKDYEQQIGQVANIADSLSAKSWPGDIAAVYQFMKALDPSSVVRESEFATAANSAGVVASVQNIFTKLESGQMLTPEQKADFAALTRKYLENKSKQYDRLYDDMARVTKLSGIPDEYLPRRASEGVAKKEWPKPISKESYDLLVSKFGRQKADAYLKLKWFAYPQ